MSEVKFNDLVIEFCDFRPKNLLSKFQESMYCVLKIKKDGIVSGQSLMQVLLIL